MTFDHTIKTQEDVTRQIREVMRPAGKMKNAIVRLRINYPREWEALIDDNAIREFANESFEFQLIKFIKKCQWREVWN